VPAVFATAGDTPATTYAPVAARDGGFLFPLALGRNSATLAPMSFPAPPAHAAARPRLIKRLRDALLIGILLAWTALVASCAYHWIHYTPPDDATPTLRVILSLLFLAGPVWLLAGRILRPARSRSPLPGAASIVSATTFLVWLAHDDRELRHAEVPAALLGDFPEAAATHALTLRYSENFPGNLAHTLPQTTLRFPSLAPGPGRDGEWAAFLANNQAEIDRLWNETAPLRAWLGELAAAPQIGDLTEDLETPLPSFRALRLASLISCAHAWRLADEGLRDDAVEAVLPVLTAARKLAPHSRTLVRRMIAIALQGRAQQTLAHVIEDGGPLSDTIRARLAAALAPDPDIVEQARMIALCELPIFQKTIMRLGPTPRPSRDAAQALPRTPLRLFVPLVFNPRRTANQAGDLFTAIAEAGAQRDFQAVKELTKSPTGPALALPGKNHAGRCALLLAVPACGNVFKSYWEAEDARAALLAQSGTGAPAR
jgi:hypothetical protein